MMMIMMIIIVFIVGIIMKCCSTSGSWLQLLCILLCKRSVAKMFGFMARSEPHCHGTAH